VCRDRHSVRIYEQGRRQQQGRGRPVYDFDTANALIGRRSSHELYRGMRDVGFVAAGLRAERRQREGL